MSTKPQRPSPKTYAEVMKLSTFDFYNWGGFPRLLKEMKKNAAFRPPPKNACEYDDFALLREYIPE